MCAEILQNKNLYKVYRNTSMEKCRLRKLTRYSTKKNTRIES